jgi:hypothetical protein
MDDPSYVFAMDEPALQRLSAEFGVVISFVVESAAGCAYFLCFENGSLRRKISYSDEDWSCQGEPLPEEAGIDVDKFYMDETEALWKAFCISPYDMMKNSTKCQAICVVDHTEYEHRSASVPDTKPITARKPWWKFW